MLEFNSPNFDFLADLDPPLTHHSYIIPDSSRLSVTYSVVKLEVCQVSRENFCGGYATEITGHG